MKRRDNKVGNSDGKVGRELTYLNEFKLTIDIFCQISNTVIRMRDIWILRGITCNTAVTAPSAPNQTLPWCTSLAMWCLFNLEIWTYMYDFLHHNDYHLMLGFDKDQVLR